MQSPMSSRIAARDSSTGLWTLDFGLWTLDCRLPDCRLSTGDCDRPRLRPRGVPAVSVHTQLAEELQVFCKLFAIDRTLRSDWRTRVREQVLDALHDLRGNRRLRLQRQRFLAVAGNERHFVGIDLEAGVSARDVVGDDEIDALSRAACGARRRRRRSSPRRSRPEAAARCRRAACRARRECPACAPAKA